MRSANLETITGMQSWYKIWLLNGHNHALVKPKILWLRKGVRESFTEPSEKPIVTETNTWNLAQLVKNYPGIIVLERLTAPRQLAQLREQ